MLQDPGKNLSREQKCGGCLWLSLQNSLDVNVSGSCFNSQRILVPDPLKSETLFSLVQKFRNQTIQGYSNASCMEITS